MKYIYVVVDDFGKLLKAYTKIANAHSYIERISNSSSRFYNIVVLILD